MSATITLHLPARTLELTPAEALAAWLELSRIYSNREDAPTHTFGHPAPIAIQVTPMPVVEPPCFYGRGTTTSP